METPSSLRRLTRSQTSAIAQKSRQEDSLSRSRPKAKPERSVLLDITNDSPIVGLAMGHSAAEKTPALVEDKSRQPPRQTPGSGEALLRGQVKALPQKVVEEGATGLGSRPPFKSPSQLIAPVNTPQILSLCETIEEDVPIGVTLASVPQEHNLVEVLKQEEPLGSSACQINRALFFDSPSKFEASQGSTAKSSEDDNSSIWPIQVNASIQEDDNAGEEDFEGDEVYFDDEEEDEETYDDLCDGLMKMTVEDKKEVLPEFAGKHTRFIYNSDDEIGRRGRGCWKTECFTQCTGAEGASSASREASPLSGGRGRN